MVRRPTILILMGVTGSGKTTIGRMFAESVGWKYFDADDFHPAANIEKMKRGVPLTDADRKPWLSRLRELISQCIERNENAAIGCSALKASYWKLLSIDESVEIVYLKGAPDVIRQRLRSRTGHYMNPDLLDSQFQTLEEPEDTLTIDVGLTPAEIIARIKEHLRIENSTP